LTEQTLTNPRTGSKPTLLKGDDTLEYSRIKNKLCSALRKVEAYEPAIDDIYIDQIVESIISSRKVGHLIKSETATEFTFSRVADAQVKFAKIIKDAFTQLCISRRDRLTDQDKTENLAEFRKALSEVLRISDPVQ